MNSPGQVRELYESKDSVDRIESVKRWDGAARTCTGWDNLRRDPELWFRNGNCLVHLYAKGQSKRGPSFKVPFSALINTRCFPLIERYIFWEGIRRPKARELVRWSHQNPSRRVDLFIPPPSNADKTQAFRYHITTRNFFAWLFRRSMVGETLGGALVGLLHSMHEFRFGIHDNISDLMDYLDEEGYLEMSHQPTNALAMLNLAKAFEMNDLYTKAFAHCVGMSDILSDNSEYQHIGSSSKHLITKAKTEMNVRICLATSMLETFLDDELSEAHLGISTGARAHLERFRSFLMSFYTTKLGYYPPRSVDGRRGIFDVSVFRTMREDFEALYDLLADDDYTRSHTMPSVAVGGICTVQLVRTFDLNHHYEPLEHPLPRMPEVRDHPSARRVSWIPRSDKPQNRVKAHAALIKAANLVKPGVLHNDLVRAYLRFEEQSISTDKHDKHEKVSLIDARKIRWILIYTVYQVLRSATNVPSEVEQDLDEANYHLSVSTASIPPWTRTRSMGSILRRRKNLTIDIPSSTIEEEETSFVESPSRIEIKPDIDYFALTHPEDAEPSRCNSTKTTGSRSLPSRSASLSRALSRSSTLRRSMRMFKTPSTTPPQAVTPTLPHHETVLQGYGNGTNDNGVDGQPEFKTVHWDPSDLYMFKSGLIEETPELECSDDITPDASIKTPSPTTDTAEFCFPLEANPPRQKRRDVVSMVTRSMSVKSISQRRSLNNLFSEGPKSAECRESAQQQRRSTFSSEGSLSRSRSRRSALFTDLKRRTFMADNRASVHEPNIDEEPYIMAEDTDWVAMQAFMEGGGCEVELVDDDVKPAWEQYADLGGLTEMR